MCVCSSAKKLQDFMNSCGDKFVCVTMHYDWHGNSINNGCKYQVECSLLL